MLGCYLLLANLTLDKVPGLRKDSDDARASSFLQLLDILPQMSAPPTHILVENVVGFEFSSTHERLVEILHREGFATQEFILSPLQFGIPYSRPRYFFLALSSLPHLSNSFSLQQVSRDTSHMQKKLNAKRRPLAFAEPELDGCLLCKPAYLECLLKKGLNSSPFRDENLFAAIKSLIFSTESEENNDTVSTVGEIPLATMGTETSDKLSEPELESSIACMPIRNYLELNYCQLKGSSNTLDKSQLNFSASKNAAEGTDKVANSSHEMQASCCSDIETLHGSVENFNQLNKKDSTTFMNDAWNHYWVPKQWVERWGDVFDIVTPDSKRCCCFTKSYGRYAKGTGSFLATKNLENLDLLYQILARKHSQQECRSTLVDAFGLRYFTSREIANLHSFPPTFTFPKHISLKQSFAYIESYLNSYSDIAIGMLYLGIVSVSELYQLCSGTFSHKTQTIQERFHSRCIALEAFWYGHLRWFQLIGLVVFPHSKAYSKECTQTKCDMLWNLRMKGHNSQGNSATFNRGTFLCNEPDELCTRLLPRRLTSILGSLKTLYDSPGAL